MQNNRLESEISLFRNLIDDFEIRKFQEKERNQLSGTAYTPYKVANYIIFRIFKLYLEDFLISNCINTESF
ncbi:MAG: hypothetical protein ACFFAO_07730, partial [Candidatus Hermodarchaeota archaeon]